MINMHDIRSIKRLNVGENQLGVSQGRCLGFFWEWETIDFEVYLKKNVLGLFKAKN